MIGMVSSGLGKINSYNFLKKMKMSVSSAAGTSVFLVAISALAGSLFHAYSFIASGNAGALPDVIPLLIFAIPGVLLGAQLGVKLSLRAKPKRMEQAVGGVFLFLALMMVYNATF